MVYSKEITVVENENFTMSTGIKKSDIWVKGIVNGIILKGNKIKMGTFTLLEIQANGEILKGDEFFELKSELETAGSFYYHKGYICLENSEKIWNIIKKKIYVCKRCKYNLQGICAFKNQTNGIYKVSDNFTCDNFKFYKKG